MIVIDGDSAVLGRLASHAAKTLLKGEDMVIVNADRVIITGEKKKIVGKYLKLRRLGSPQHGPFFPKSPDMIVKRTVRGMLPYKSPKGRAALKKLRVYAGNPEGFKNAKSFDIKEIRTDFITVGRLAKQLGWAG